MTITWQQTFSLTFCKIPNPEKFSEPVVIQPTKKEMGGKFTFYFLGLPIAPKIFVVRNPTHQRMLA